MTSEVGYKFRVGTLRTMCENSYKAPIGTWPVNLDNLRAKLDNLISPNCILDFQQNLSIKTNIPIVKLQHYIETP